MIMIILDSPQSGPFLPINTPLNQSNVINVRRHLYSPSQLPQGLTEGQLVMLLQKGSQYQPVKSEPTMQPTQIFPGQQNQAQVIENHRDLSLNR